MKMNYQFILLIIIMLNINFIFEAHAKSCPDWSGRYQLLDLASCPFIVENEIHLPLGKYSKTFDNFEDLFLKKNQIFTIEQTNCSKFKFFHTYEDHLTNGFYNSSSSEFTLSNKNLFIKNEKIQSYKKSKTLIGLKIKTVERAFEINRAINKNLIYQYKDSFRFDGHQTKSSYQCEFKYLGEMSR